MTGILKGWINQTDNEPPNVHVWMWQIYENNELLYIIASIEAFISTIIVLILTAIHLYFVMKYVSQNSLQTGLYWIVFLCPIVSLCGCIGLLIPRTGAFLYSIGIVYMLFCAFILVTIMTTLYGSRTAMCIKMFEKGVRLNLRQCPFACCLLCLRDIEPSAPNLRILEWFIFQSPILRVVIEILSMAVYFELQNKENVYFTIASIISLLSMLIASYGSYVLIPAGSKHLTQYRFLTMFRIIDTAQFLYNFQMTVLNMLVLFDFFNIDKKSYYINNSTKVQFWASFLATQEMLIVSCISTYLFRPSKSALFDKHPHCGDKTAVLPLINQPSQNPFVCNPAIAAPTTDEKAQNGLKQSKVNDNQLKEKEKTSKLNPNVENVNPVKTEQHASSKNGSPAPAQTQPSNKDRDDEILPLERTQSSQINIDLKAITTDKTQEQTNIIE